MIKRFKMGYKSIQNKKMLKAVKKILMIENAVR